MGLYAKTKEQLVLEEIKLGVIWQGFWVLNTSNPSSLLKMSMDGLHRIQKPLNANGSEYS